MYGGQRPRRSLGIKSAGCTSRARASFSIVSRVAERCARSMNEIAVRCRSERKPSSSWESPRERRTSRTRSPKSMAKGLDFTGQQSLAAYKKSTYKSSHTPGERGDGTHSRSGGCWELLQD